MQCSREQIEEKRRIALERLAKKQYVSSGLTNFTSNNIFLEAPSLSASTSPVSSPRFKFTATSNSASKLITSTHSSKPYERVTTFNNNKNKTVIICKCLLKSEDRFDVDLSSYSTVAIDIFKTIPSRQYDINTKSWNFALSDYESLIFKLQSKPELALEKIPLFVIKCMKLPRSNILKTDLSRLDSELLNTLMPFQREGICFGIEKKGRCLIADDMGLGKTFQALGIADYYRNDWPLLIVTTATMKQVWQETILRYLPDSVSPMYISHMTTTKDYIDEIKVLIVSHDLMGRSIEKLLEKNFGVIIIDESHIFKNYKAKGTQAANLLTKKAKRVILLSGTPALSRPSELYTQLSFIDEKFFISFFEYSKRYCDGKTTNFGWDSSGQSNLQELEIVLAKKFMIRRTKDKVLLSIPNKVQEIVELDVNLDKFSQDERKCLLSLAEKYNSEKKSAQKHAILLTFFSETAKIKIPSVASYILQVLKEKRKFLVFAHHQIMLEAVEQALKRANTQYIRIDGSTTTDQRSYFVNKFQVNDKCVCAILSITAANAGITLTAADLVVFAELHWNPSILSQAESRAHRIGQDKAVAVRYLIAKGTADDSIWPMLEKKQNILKKAGLFKDNFSVASVSKQSNIHDTELLKGFKTKSPSKNGNITDYFARTEKSPTKSSRQNSPQKSPRQDIFDDGLDDALCSIEF